MAINILVIDDDRKMAERLMRGLQRADKENILGEIQVDDSVIKLETVENYDISHFETTFDVALIDYQLSSSFTGILVSAWIALYLQIPRLTLTTASSKVRSISKVSRVFAQSNRFFMRLLHDIRK